MAAKKTTNADYEEYYIPPKRTKSSAASKALMKSRQDAEGAAVVADWESYQASGELAEAIKHFINQRADINQELDLFEVVVRLLPNGRVDTVRLGIGD